MLLLLWFDIELDCFFVGWLCKLLEELLVILLIWLLVYFLRLVWLFFVLGICRFGRWLVLWGVVFVGYVRMIKVVVFDVCFEKVLLKIRLYMLFWLVVILWVLMDILFVLYLLIYFIGMKFLFVRSFWVELFFFGNWLEFFVLENCDVLILLVLDIGGFEERRFVVLLFGCFIILKLLVEVVLVYWLFRSKSVCVKGREMFIWIFYVVECFRIRCFFCWFGFSE